MLLYWRCKQKHGDFTNKLTVNYDFLWGEITAVIRQQTMLIITFNSVSTCLIKKKKKTYLKIELSPRCLCVVDVCCKQTPILVEQRVCWLMGLYGRRGLVSYTQNDLLRAGRELLEADSANNEPEVEAVWFLKVRPAGFRSRDLLPHERLCAAGEEYQPDEIKHHCC